MRRRKFHAALWLQWRRRSRRKDSTKEVCDQFSPAQPPEAVSADSLDLGVMLGQHRT